jgi:DNA modification methylase
VSDCVQSSRGNKTLHHPWAQGTPEASYYIQKLSRKGSLVCDPFLGGGTTAIAAIRLGRRCIGFEIDPDTARKTEARISRVCQAGEELGDIPNKSRASAKSKGPTSTFAQ